MKTIEQTRRELFEAAYKAQVEGTCAGTFVPDVFSRNMSDGAYMISPVQCAWWGFNAALKAQPSGVVLPERKTKADYGVYIDEFANEAAAIHNATLDEVARLNSPPVSAGGVDDRE